MNEIVVAMVSRRWTAYAEVALKPSGTNHFYFNWRATNLTGLKKKKKKKKKKKEKKEKKE